MKSDLKKMRETINREWIGGYTAKIVNNELVVYLNNYRVADVTEKGKVTAEQGFNDVAESLENLVSYPGGQ